ncbi:MAG: hypothetical protein V4622_08800 [Bacteroidota bacterium]
MSYDIRLFRKEAKEKYYQAKEDFFEDENNLVNFSEEQKEKLKNRLLTYNYCIENENEFGIHFAFINDESIEAILGKNCLFFSSTGEGVFEISMTSSEFTDSGEFVKFDPQNNSWE